MPRKHFEGKVIKSKIDCIKQAFQMASIVLFISLVPWLNEFSLGWGLNAASNTPRVKCISHFYFNLNDLKASEMRQGRQAALCHFFRWEAKPKRNKDLKSLTGDLRKSWSLNPGVLSLISQHPHPRPHRVSPQLPPKAQLFTVTHIKHTCRQG